MLKRGGGVGETHVVTSTVPVPAMGSARVQPAVVCSVIWFWVALKKQRGVSAVMRDDAVLGRGTHSCTRGREGGR